MSAFLCLNGHNYSPQSMLISAHANRLTAYSACSVALTGEGGSRQVKDAPCERYSLQTAETVWRFNGKEENLKRSRAEHIRKDMFLQW